MVLLINPPQVYAETMTAAGVVPPLGLLYLAAYIRSREVPVRIIDSVVEGLDTITPFAPGVMLRGLTIPEIARRVGEENPRLVGISNLFSFAFPAVAALAAEIKRVCPGTKVVLGGAHPSALPEETLRTEAVDFVVISEGEHTLHRLYAHLLDPNLVSLKTVDGLAYRQDGRIMVNRKRTFIEDLDALPFPARDLVPQERYAAAKESHGMSEASWTAIISSRGCPYECTFCTPDLWGRRYRMRSAENVLKEIAECRRLGITEFHFEDENLTLEKERMIRICEGIAGIDKGIRWQAPNGIRASVTDLEILAAMKRSGCEHITVAPESGSPRVLDEIIRKRQDLGKVVEVIRNAKRVGLRTLAYFILGLPGETKADIEETLSFVRKLARIGLDEVGFSNYIPLPGSALYGQLKREGKLDRLDWLDLLSIADLKKSISWTGHISGRELQTYRRRAYLSFHITKLAYHPGAVLRSIGNILTGRQALKTERVVRTMIARKFKRLFGTV